MNLTLSFMNVTNASSTAASSVFPTEGESKLELVRLGDLQVTTGHPLTTSDDVSDKPCGEALSSQTPSTVALPGSLDALLYIVIVLMFYAFSIVILMVKYIRREREGHTLRNYYHAFVSRDKFRSLRFANNHTDRGSGSSRYDEEDGDPGESWDVESNRTWRFHGKNSQPSTRINNGITFSKLHLGCDNDDTESTKRIERRFTFLGAKSLFCKNNHKLGDGLCNRKLCSKCISDSVPTIDWGDETESQGSRDSRDVIRINLRPSSFREYSSPNFQNTFNSESRVVNQDRGNLNSRISVYEDNVFSPIIECDSENSFCGKIDHVQNNTNKRTSRSSFNSPRGSLFDDRVIVSSCSLEVSELLANMPPLGVAKSFSNDMDTLDGLSNLESETENQSLLNYSSSIRHHHESDMLPPIRKPENEKAQPINDADTSDKLSERSSLLSCSLSFDEGSKNIAPYSFPSLNISSSDIVFPSLNNFSSDYINVNDSNGRHSEFSKESHKLPLSSSFSFSEKGRDKEMVRILNNINLLSDESGVFKNLTYFLRGFYKSDVDDTTETSNLLPKETYFGPDSPKSGKGHKPVSPAKFLTEDNVSIPSMTDFRCSDDVVNSLGSHWAYAYDPEDGGLISDTDMSSSSFGNYCMDDLTESGPADSQADHDSAKDSKQEVGCFGSSDDRNVYGKKVNSMLAGYGPARKETKV